MIDSYFKKVVQDQEILFSPCYIGRIQWRYRQKEESFRVRTERKRNTIALITVTGYCQSETVGELKLTLIRPSHFPNAFLAEKKPSGTAWRSFSREEIVRFSRENGDRNPIHLTEIPVVQGMLLFSELLKITGWTGAECRFFYPVLAGQTVFLEMDCDVLQGSTECGRCLILKRTEGEDIDCGTEIENVYDD